MTEKVIQSDSQVLVHQQEQKELTVLGTAGSRKVVIKVIARHTHKSRASSRACACVCAEGLLNYSVQQTDLTAKPVDMLHHILSW
jgi:hypothetical protein